MPRYPVPLRFAVRWAPAVAGMTVATGVVAVAAVAGPAAAATAAGGQTATGLLAAAKKAEAAAGSVHLVGRITEGKTVVTFVLDVDHAGDGQGTFTEVGQALKVKKVGSNIYVYANQRFWAKAGGTAVANKIGHRWVTTSTTNTQFKSLAQFFGISRMTTGLLPPGAAQPTKGAATTVDGHQTIPLQTTKSGGSSTATTTLYVAATGPRYVMKATARNGGEVGTLTFSRYGEKVRVQPPAKPLN